VHLVKVRAHLDNNGAKCFLQYFQDVVPDLLKGIVNQHSELISIIKDFKSVTSKGLDGILASIQQKKHNVPRDDQLGDYRNADIQGSLFTPAKPTRPLFSPETPEMVRKESISPFEDILAGCSHISAAENELPQLIFRTESFGSSMSSAEDVLADCSRISAAEDELYFRSSMSFERSGLKGPDKQVVPECSGIEDKVFDEAVNLDYSLKLEANHSFTDSTQEVSTGQQEVVQKTHRNDQERFWSRPLLSLPSSSEDLQDNLSSLDEGEWL
jgi:hypothetical protein